MMTITLRNDFHNTTVDLRAASLPHTLTPSQERRVLRVLCGVTGCTCGGVRGPQRGPDGRRLTVERDWYGSATDGNGYPALTIREREAA